MCFICGLGDHFIKNDPKMDTSDKKVQWNTKNPKTCAYISTKIDKCWKTVQMKVSHKIYMHPLYDIYR